MKKLSNLVKKEKLKVEELMMIKGAAAPLTMGCEKHACDSQACVSSSCMFFTCTTEECASTAKVEVRFNNSFL